LRPVTGKYVAPVFAQSIDAAWTMAAPKRGEGGLRHFARVSVRERSALPTRPKQFQDRQQPEAALKEPQANGSNFCPANPVALNPAVC